MPNFDLDTVRPYLIFGVFIGIGVYWLYDTPQDVRDRAFVRGETRALDATVGVLLKHPDKGSYYFFDSKMVNSVMTGAQIAASGSAMLSDVRLTFDSGRVISKAQRGYNNNPGINLQIHARVTIPPNATLAEETLSLRLPGLLELAHARFKKAYIIPQRDFPRIEATSTAVRKIPIYDSRDAVEREARIWQFVKYGIALLYLPLLAHLLKRVLAKP